ncbi:MAG TPA: sugar phosphate nucleotidyltransferase [Pirellulaceae bacterium]|nr:sugar phosphate nucleotidyltransferase [Pirellulaceae bacterium]
MRGIALAATHETRLTASGRRVPLPLVDVVDEPYLTTLCRRLAAVPDMSEIIVVTNDAIFREIEDWAASLPDLGVTVRSVNDGTLQPEDRKGAVADILFALDAIGVEDDILIVGGDNWFTYDLNEFVQQSLDRSPSVAVTRVSPGPLTSRFGWVELADGGLISRFVEHPGSSTSDQTLKASCVYYLSANDLSWLQEFEKTESTVCSPGTFFAWLVERADVFGIELKGKWHGDRASRGPDALSLRDIVRQVANPRYTTWERQAAKELEWATSHADLVDALEDQDANKRIIAAQLLGHSRATDEYGRELLSKQGLEAVISALLRHLGDDATNTTDGTWQSDDDERPVSVSDTVARSLMNLGYAESPQAVREKATRTKAP